MLYFSIADVVNANRFSFPVFFFIFFRILNVSVSYFYKNAVRLFYVTWVLFLFKIKKMNDILY